MNAVQCSESNKKAIGGRGIGGLGCDDYEDGDGDIGHGLNTASNPYIKAVT